MPLTDIFVIAAAALFSAALCVFWVVRSPDLTTGKQPEESAPDRATVSMLFVDGMLQHSSERANKHYQLIPDQGDWQSIRRRLIDRFPELPETPQAVPEGFSTIRAGHPEDMAAISLAREGQFLRLNMVEQTGQEAELRERLNVVYAELQKLKRASDTTPHAIWQTDKNARVIWYNAAYEALYQKLHRSAPDPEMPVVEVAMNADDEYGRQRISTKSPNQNNKDWYDINVMTSGDITIFHAVDVNAVVKSEVAQRNFVQTLAKTFAQLSTGLAIFDRNSQLALFNPALIDLTALPADFLSGRPTLISFFDRLRENRRMPEPKNYHSWRQQITEVIAAATDGRYQETWTLETGQTFRVNGRPHPDGAIAFLIEDVSAEISLTRNFRAELEMGQSLMDTFEDGLAVFSSSGVLSFSNLAYRELWGLDPENTFTDVTITDSVKEWKKMCKPGARWAQLTDFVLDYGEKSSWAMPVSLSNGSNLSCVVSRVASGATMVRFSNLTGKRKKSSKAQLQSNSA